MPRRRRWGKLKQMKFFVPALLALAFPGIAAAAPAKPAAAKPSTSKISIDARARAVFARATRLYGAAKGLGVRWKGHDGYRDSISASLDFDRAGRLHLANSNVLESVIVVDGKNRWSLSAPQKGTKPVYTRVESEENEVFDEMGRNRELASALGGLLAKSTPFDAEQMEMKFELLQLQEFRAVLLAPQPFGGQMCDLVRISEISPPTFTRHTLRTGQKTYWFARSDGRLMRVQQRILFGSKEKSTGDWQIIAQTFNPKFAPNTFKFTPPRGAKLETD